MKRKKRGKKAKIYRDTRILIQGEKSHIFLKKPKKRKLSKKFDIKFASKQYKNIFSIENTSLCIESVLYFKK